MESPMPLVNNTFDFRRDYSDVSVVMAYDASEAARMGSTAHNAELYRIGGDRLILVDYDNTGDVGLRASFLDTNPLFIHAQHATASAARNAGLARVKTTFVVFVVPGHRFDHLGIDGLLASAEQANSDITLGPSYSHKVYDKWEDSISYELEPRWPPPSNDPETFLISWLRGKTVSMNAHLWRTDFLRQLGGWQEEMLILEDIELVARATLKGATIATADWGKASSGGRPDPDRVDWAGSAEAIRSAFEGLLALESMTMSADMREALGKRLYDLARPAFRLGFDALGAEILQKARGLGLLTHPGTLLHKASAGLLGLERKERMRRTVGRRLPALVTA